MEIDGGRTERIYWWGFILQMKGYVGHNELVSTVLCMSGASMCLVSSTDCSEKARLWYKRFYHTLLLNLTVKRVYILRRQYL